MLSLGQKKKINPSYKTVGKERRKESSFANLHESLPMTTTTTMPVMRERKSENGKMDFTQPKPGIGI